MDKDLLIAIIGMIGTILGVIIGVFLQFPYNYFRDKFEIQKEFESLKNEIFFCGQTNSYDNKLFQLRKFFIKNLDQSSMF